MPLNNLKEYLKKNSLGSEMYHLITELYPLCRSITGDGLRESLRILQRHISLEIYEVPTGTPVFDWTIPKEWNVREAYIKNAVGEKIVDFNTSTLHLLNYSIPIHQIMPLAELKKHLFSIPERPDWIPYRTSYYQENWGFCLQDRVLQNLVEGDYEVFIDTSLEEGYLTYGEYYLPGKTEDEILISCHCCHPSLCNDNLSGMALATYLAKSLTSLSHRYSYRFLFIPGTIGAITWLSLNEDKVGNIKHGLVVACVGDKGQLTYKKSRRGNAEIDRAVQHVLAQSGQAYGVREFSPIGYDERQYCSPGFNLPVGSLTRTPHGCFPEYHTSADNLDLVQPAYLADSLTTYGTVLTVLENNRTYLNTNPKCEPQLGRRGLFGVFGGLKDSQVQETAMLWILNLSDGQHTLLDIAEKSNLEFDLVANVAEVLLHHSLLKICPEPSSNILGSH